MFLAKLSINRPVLVTMLVSVLVVFFFLSYFGLPLNLMPDAEIPFITVQTIYPGGSPKEIETQISKKIEDEISTISKIDYIESYSMENISYVIIAFELGKDANIANQEVKDKVNAIINQFPDVAERPSIKKFNIGAEAIMDIILTGDQSAKELYQVADFILKDRFSQIEGVAQVQLTGGQEREIHVKLDDKIVMQNFISLPQLAQVLGKQNLNMPAGNFKDDSQEYSVRTEGEITSLEQLKDIDIPTPFGSKKLHQIAKVEDSGEEIRERTIYFDNVDKVQSDNVIRISILKTSEGNPVEISEAVRNKLPEIRKEIPRTMQLEIIDDNSDFIESSVNDTLNNVILGIIFTGLILLFFLHDLRSTLIVAIAMPTSIISTFLLMQVADFSLNMLTLMGLSTSVGILVTNSVVVIENIFRHMRMGNGRREASYKGTTEITVAVIASTLTNIMVFLPLALMDTIAGQFLKEFALTVTFATIFSLLVSFTITPMLASLILPEKKKKHPIGDRMEKMFANWEKRYQILLEKIIHNKKRAVGVLIISAILFVLSFQFTKHIGFEFMPNMDEGNISIEFELPEGYNIEQTARMYSEMENIIIKHSTVKHLLATVGSQSSIDKATNLGKIDIKLIDAAEREKSTEQIVNELIEDLAVLANTKIQVSAQSSGAGGGADIEFYLQGQNLEQLTELKEEMMKKAADIEGLLNFDSSLRPGKPELTLVPDRLQMEEAGVSVYELALTLRAAVEGIVSTQYKENGNEYDIKISLNDNSVNSATKIENIPVITAKGRYRLSQLATLKYTKGATKIIHRDKYTTIKFTGDVGIGYAQSDVVNALRQIQTGFKLPGGYKFDWGGMSEMMEENNREMGKAFGIAILLTYMLLAAILESFTKPFLILLTLPLALIGVFASLFIFSINFNMVSMMAIIMLLGIVVNAAILLLDYTMILRERGKSTKDALVEACPTKLKPIIMSSAAIILGMLPMAIGIGASGAEMRKALGIVSIGGLIVATFMTLLVIPAFYYLTTKEHIEVKKKVG